MIEKWKQNSRQLFKCFFKVINLTLCSDNNVKKTGYP